MSAFCMATDAPAHRSIDGYRALLRAVFAPYEPSGLGVLQCPTCKGDGEVDVPPRGHRGGTVAPWEWESEECDDCDGTGLQKCGVCGGEPAVGLDGDGYPTGAACLAEEEATIRSAASPPSSYPARGSSSADDRRMGPAGSAETTRPATKGQGVARGLRGRRVLREQGTRGINESFNPAIGGGGR